jgi:hypothetical protein
MATKSGIPALIAGAVLALLGFVSPAQSSILETWNDATYADRLAEPGFLGAFVLTSGRNYLRSETTFSNNAETINARADDNSLLSFNKVAAQSEYGTNRARGTTTAVTLSGPDQDVENALASSEWAATFTVNGPVGQLVPITFNVAAEGIGYGSFTPNFTYIFSIGRTSDGAVVTGEEQYAWLCLLDCTPETDDSDLVIGFAGFKSEASTFTLDLVGGASYQLRSLLEAGARTQTVEEVVSCIPGPSCTVSGLDAFNTAVFGPIVVPNGVTLDFTEPGFTVTAVPGPASLWLLVTALGAGFRLSRPIRR